MRKADMETKLKELEQEVKRLRAQVSVMAIYSPPVRLCHQCGNYYAQGYLCYCGHDNSVPKEATNDPTRSS